MKHLRLSSSGQCTRALAFDLSGYPRAPFDDASRRRMDLGFRFEALVIRRLELLGFTIRDQQRAVGLEGVSGHIDGTIAREDMPLRLLECKSMGASSWRDWRANGIRFARAPYVRGYYSQVQAYMAGLRAEGVEVDGCQLVVAFRDDSPDPCAGDFAVEQETVAFDEEEVARVRGRLLLAMEHGRPGQPPPETLREHGLDDAGFLAPACKWCDHKEPCWGPILEVSVGRSVRLMPASETVF